MLRLFVAAPLVAGERLSLPAGAARHAQVRRLQPGAALVLFDGRGGEWQCEVAAMHRHGVDVHVRSHVHVDRELPLLVTLVVGMPANERMDWLVEKATELGVSSIRPLLSGRSVLRVIGERAERRRAHWQAVAVAAAEQSGRTSVPRIEPVAVLEETLASLARDAASSARWLLSPGADASPRRPAPASSIVLLSGPEGGLSGDEEAAARAAGFQPVGLGPRVLRAETAPLAVLAWLGLGG